MSMCPHTRQSDPMDLETAFFCHDSPLRDRFRAQIRLWGFQFDGGGYYGVRMARRRSRANGIWEMSDRRFPAFPASSIGSSIVAKTFSVRPQDDPPSSQHEHAMQMLA